MSSLEAPSGTDGVGLTHAGEKREREKGGPGRPTPDSNQQEEEVSVMYCTLEREREEVRCGKACSMHIL